MIIRGRKMRFENGQRIRVKDGKRFLRGKVFNLEGRLEFDLHVKDKYGTDVYRFSYRELEQI